MKTLPPAGALLLGLASCASTGAQEDPVEFPSIANKRAEVEVETDSIGHLMARLDQSVRGWNNLKQAPRTEENDRKRRGLESWIQSQARLNLADLIGELESGPLNNRSVASVALGFSGLEEAQSPLLSALEDREELVVGNALLGLGILGMADTPLAQVCHLLARSPDATVRRNAAFALQRIIEAGGGGEQALDAARLSLQDTEPSVRVMGAVILALLDDAESMRSLGDLLYDEEDFVCFAAATSLGRIGSAHESRTGEAARMLVAALDRGNASRRTCIHRELARLRGANLGDDVEAWREWAYRVP